MTDATPMEDREPEPVQGADRIRAFIPQLPDAPGVYRMISADGSVLYVGKARSLKKRVTSYTRMAGHTNRIARMIMLTADMEFVSTETETEALLLEANLIKQLKPRYNVLLRDDKSFPHILITDHAYPADHQASWRSQGNPSRVSYYGPICLAPAP